MEKRFFSGPTLEQAVLDAARHHGVDPAAIRYVDRSKSSGRLRGGRRSVIEVDPTAPTAPRGDGDGTRDADARASSRAASVASARVETPPPAVTATGAESERPTEPESRTEDQEAEAEEADGAEAGDGDAGVDAEVAVAEESRRPPAAEEAAGEAVATRREALAAAREEREERRRSRPASAEAASAGATATGGTAPEDGTTAAEAADHALGALLRLAGLELDWEIVEDEEGVSVDLSGPDTEEVTAEDGEVLHALEHLLPRVLRGWYGKGVPVRVDCDGFVGSRENELRELALEVAEDVAESGEEEALEPMTPAERRIVHLALADHPDVTTESRGRGFRKRVRIFPQR